MSSQSDFEKQQKDSKVSPHILDENNKSKDAPKTQDEYIDSMPDEGEENDEETDDSQDNQVSDIKEQAQILKNMNLSKKVNELCSSDSNSNSFGSFFIPYFNSMMKYAKKGKPFTYEDMKKDKS